MKKLKDLIMLIRPSERFIFKVGSVFLVLEAFLIASLSLVDAGLSRRIACTITAGLLGGRMASSTTGLELGIQPWMLAIILCVFNLTWLAVFFPLSVS